MRFLSDLAKSFFATSIILVVLGVATSASAAWMSNATSTSGTFAMASFGHNFTPVSGGGTGGQTFVSPTAYLISAKTYYLTVTNNSSVSATVNGTMGAVYGGLGAPAVTVRTCDASWTGSNCPNAVTVANGTPSDPISFSYGTVAAGGVIRIAVTVGALLDNTSIYLTANATPARSGLDRTAG